MFLDTQSFILLKAKLYPGFAEYQMKTTRQIPVIALES